MATLKGGDKLEARLREIAKNLDKGGTLKVGFLAGSTYPDGTSVPLVAAIQEFGAPSRKIPPRPFFRNMIAAKKGEWPAAAEANLKATNYDVPKTLELMGQGIASQLQQSIIDTNSPPLSPITVMLRGMRSHDQNLVVTGKTVGEAARRVREGKTNYGASSKPLMDQGVMLNSIDYEVDS